MCGECCIQACAASSACAHCQEKRLQHIEKRMYNTEQQLSNIKQEVEANTACRKNQAIVIRDVANLEVRIEKLAQNYESLSQNGFKDFLKTGQRTFDKSPIQFGIPEEIRLQEKGRQLNKHGRSTEEIHQSLNEIEKWSQQSSHRQPDHRHMTYIPTSNMGTQRSSYSHDTLPPPLNNLSQRSPLLQQQQSYSTSATYPNVDLDSFYQAFSNLYNILKTDRDPSLQNSPERVTFNTDRIFSQDKKFLAHVEQLQKEFQQLAVLLEKEKELSPEKLEYNIAQKLEELGNEFQSLKKILKTNSPHLNPNNDNPGQIRHYEQIEFCLEELQLEINQLASLLKQNSPATSQTGYPTFNDEKIASCIRDIQKRLQRLNQLLKSATPHTTDVTQIANQDETIKNYLQEVEQKCELLNKFLKANSPSQMSNM